MYLDGDDMEEYVQGELELLTDEATVAPGAEPRTWALPDAPLLLTWISKYAKGNAVTNAVDVPPPVIEEA